MDIKEKLTKAISSLCIRQEIADDLVFHIIDWKDDLYELVGMYENLECLSDDEIRDIIIGFLAHAPNHIAAAKKLIGLGPIEDVFNIGVFEEDE